MTHQQLLIPRWLVLGDWPNREHNKFNIGDVITDSISPKELPRDQNGNLRWKFEWEKYPRLFKKLMWWEQYTPQELFEHVKFIKNTETSEVYIVYKFHTYNCLEGFFVDELCQWSKFIFLNRTYVPATEEDYHQFRASK